MTQSTLKSEITSLSLILDSQPILYVNLVGQPYIELPLIAKADKRKPYPIKHRRVVADLAGFVWKKGGLMPSRSAIGVILRILESKAWENERSAPNIQDAMDEDPLLESVLIYLELPEIDGSFHGTCTKLLNELEKRTKKYGCDIRHKSWPKGATQLSKRLKALESVLNQAGFALETGRDSGRARFIELSRNSTYDGDQHTAS